MQHIRAAIPPDIQRLDSVGKKHVAQQDSGHRLGWQGNANQRSHVARGGRAQAKGLLLVIDEDEDAVVNRQRGHRALQRDLGLEAQIATPLDQHLHRAAHALAAQPARGARLHIQATRSSLARAQDRQQLIRARSRIAPWRRRRRAGGKQEAGNEEHSAAEKTVIATACREIPGQRRSAPVSGSVSGSDQRGAAGVGDLAERVRCAKRSSPSRKTHTNSLTLTLTLTRPASRPFGRPAIFRQAVAVRGHSLYPLPPSCAPGFDAGQALLQAPAQALIRLLAKGLAIRGHGPFGL